MFHGKHASADLIVWTIACLAAGLGLRGTARVFGIDANTVLQWLTEAAEQLQAFSGYFLHELGLRLADQHIIYRAPQSESAAAGGGDPAARGVPEASRAGAVRSWKRVVGVDDRLIDPTQAAWGRSELFIRRQRVHDPNLIILRFREGRVRHGLG